MGSSTDGGGATALARLRQGVDGVFSRTLRPTLVQLRDRTDQLIERRYGLDTHGIIVFSEHDEERAFYRPLPWTTLRRILRKGEVGPDDVFIDFGAGKGRAVFLAAHGYPFKRVIGVELLPDLSEIARANIERTRDRLLCKDVEIVTSDVLDYAIPDDVTIAFFYNPFGGEIFASVIRKLLASYDRKPRRLRVIYQHPVELEPLLATGRFRQVRFARGLRPTRSWARTFDTHLFEVLPAPVSAPAQAG